MNYSLYFQLDLQLQDESGGDISSFITNGEWELLGLYVEIYKLNMEKQN